MNNATLAPQVSIIILNYNTNELAIDCIRSVYEKTKGVSYEIVVVDNASPRDNPEEIIRIFPEVRLIKSKENLGFAKGNNLGIAHAKAPVYLLLNSDTVLINDAVSIAYDKLMEREDTGITGAQLQFPDGSYQYSAQRFPLLKYQLIQLFRIQKLMPPAKRGRYMLGGYFSCEENVYADWIWGTFYMIKKEVIEKMPDNKLADDFFMYCEDFQWGLEAEKTGYKTLFVSDAKIIHYVGKNNFSNTMITTNYGIIYKRYYGKMHYKAYLFLEKLAGLLTFKKKV